MVWMSAGSRSMIHSRAATSKGSTSSANGFILLPSYKHPTRSWVTSRGFGVAPSEPLMILCTENPPVPPVGNPPSQRNAQLLVLRIVDDYLSDVQRSWIEHPRESLSDLGLKIAIFRKSC